MSKIKILHTLLMVHTIAYKIYIWHKLLSQKEWIFKHLQNKVKHIYTKYTWSSKPILHTDFCMWQHGLETTIASLIRPLWYQLKGNWHSGRHNGERDPHRMRSWVLKFFFKISKALWWWLDERHPLIIIHIPQELSRNHKDQIFMQLMHEYEDVP